MEKFYKIKYTTRPVFVSNRLERSEEQEKRQICW